MCVGGMGFSSTIIGRLSPSEALEKRRLRELLGA
jgi:hypothetical protein